MVVPVDLKSCYFCSIFYIFHFVGFRWHFYDGGEPLALQLTAQGGRVVPGISVVCNVSICEVLEPLFLSCDYFFCNYYFYVQLL